MLRAIPGYGDHQALKEYQVSKERRARLVCQALRARRERKENQARREVLALQARRGLRQRVWSALMASRLTRSSSTHQAVR